MNNEPNFRNKYYAIRVSVESAILVVSSSKALRFLCDIEILLF